MKAPRGGIEWANMSGKFQNTECSICQYGLEISGSACEEDSCLVDIPISQHTLIANLIKILEIE